MGILDDGRDALNERQSYEREMMAQSRQAIVREFMEGLSDVLAAPEFVGDVETALVHYMGSEAFYDQEATEGYIDLSKRVFMEADEPVPVLFVYGEVGDRGQVYGYDTTLVKVDHDNIAFRSTKKRDEKVKMHAFTDETAGVSRKKIALLGRTTTFAGNILTASSPLTGDVKVAEEFDLSTDNVADNGRGGGMGEYQFGDHGKDLFGGKLEIMVGWREIEAAFIKRLVAGGDRPSVSEVLKLTTFFEATGDLETIHLHAPRIAKMISVANDFQAVLGSLATERT